MRGAVTWLLLMLAATLASAQTSHVTIAVDSRDSVGSFDPLRALGSTIDGHADGATRYIFTPRNVAAMKSANFHSISYRIRTELGIEAWHWNPRGHWSDATHSEGYWTSDDNVGDPIRVSYGYRLPRRGNSIDQANDEGYSRLTDGDTSTFWKSDPYLDSLYTKEPNERHPQWVIVDLDSVVELNAIGIDWGTPYATRYDVQYWPGEQPKGPDDNTDDSVWRNFARGRVNGGPNAVGGKVRISLASAVVRSRWLRILMYSSSHRGPAASRDVRDALGFAIRELYIGRMSGGRFVEVSRHARDGKAQTRAYASSTDPWHSARDRDDGTEQPGIDIMFSSGLSRGLPMLLPVGVLYDTPANAAALFRYVRRRHYAVPRVELGEEPDGQFVSPADFGALYVQVADSLRAVDPDVTLGGPSLQDARTKVMMAWKSDATDVRSWLAHFVDALAARHHMRDLGFVSFEFYPFDNACTPTAPQLADVAPKMRDAVSQFRSDGVPPTVPLLMTEYGYSPFSTAAEMSRAGAILNTIAVAEFLSDGGAESYFYGTEPSALDRNESCDSWGDNTLLLADEQRHVLAKNATYHAARMLTTFWADSAGGGHTLIRTRVSGDGGGASNIDAYALRRPNGRISILMINRDPKRAISATVNGVRSSFDLWRLSSAEYVWHPDGADGHARPNTGPRKISVAAGGEILLPPYSITVLRER